METKYKIGLALSAITLSFSLGMYRIGTAYREESAKCYQRTQEEIEKKLSLRSLVIEWPRSEDPECISLDHLVVVDKLGRRYVPNRTGSISLRGEEQSFILLPRGCKEYKKGIRGEK